ncbi:MAG: hypothetical protein DMG79_16395 [Acidobacteria bacterium]|nr:MAG: hypothetical protein DMG79_16395 [Acidobacteriota bacterium]
MRSRIGGTVWVVPWSAARWPRSSARPTPKSLPGWATARPGHSGEFASLYRGIRACLQYASSSCVSIDKAEKEKLGFTHCEAGKLLAEQWHVPPDLAEVIEFHHSIQSATNARALVSLVHLSDLLCRVRDLGYGYYEVMGIDFAGDSAWAALVEAYPKLEDIDLARLSLDIEGAMGEVVALVDAVFSVKT